MKMGINMSEILLKEKEVEKVLFISEKKMYIKVSFLKINFMEKVYYLRGMAIWLKDILKKDY